MGNSGEPLCRLGHRSAALTGEPVGEVGGDALHRGRQQHRVLAEPDPFGLGGAFEATDPVGQLVCGKPGYRRGECVGVCQFVGKATHRQGKRLLSHRHQFAVDEVRQRLVEGVGARIPGGLIAARPGLDGASGRGGKHLVVRSGRRLNRIAHERHGLVDLGGAQVVRTVEREERGRGTLGNHVKQAPLGGGQRRIGRQHHQRTLRVADRRHRRGVVVLKDRLEPWGVHQRHARLQQLRRCRHKNPGDTLGVVGIVGLAHPVRQLCDGDGSTAAVVQLDQRGSGPVTHLGGD